MSLTELQFQYKDYPLIPIILTHKDKDTPFIDALLDSGGDFIVIPKAIAQYLELPLCNASRVDTAGGATKLYTTKVKMTMSDGEHSTVYDDLEIHVSTRNDIPVLIGRYPIFEDYEIIFRKYQDKLILNPVSKN
jgi:predicted aspartyl protease